MRVDAGVDIYSSNGDDQHAAPRFNAALGTKYPGGGFFLESATTYLPLPGRDAAWHSTLAGSLRFRWPNGRWYSPFEAGVGAVAPLTNQLLGWAVMVDLRVTTGPATYFACCEEP